MYKVLTDRLSRRKLNNTGKNIFAYLKKSLWIQNNLKTKIFCKIRNN